jgi:hypothetical protein
MKRREYTYLFSLLIIILVIVVSPLGTVIQREARYIIHPIPPPIPVNMDMLIGAYYYPWYDTNYHWSEGYSGHPVLGEYSSRDPYVADLHIKWAVDHGISFFAVSWWGDNSWEDLSLRIGLLRAKYLGSIKFCIFYETKGLLGEIGSAEKAKETLRFHMLYLASVFFHLPQYLRIDGKPVLIFYAAGILRDKLGANFEPVFQELRTTVRVEEGLDLYLMGDVIHSIPTRRDDIFLRVFDAVTGYCPILTKRYDRQVTEAEEMYAAWRSRAERFGTAIVPSVFPGFDNTRSNIAQKVIVVPRSVDGFEKFCQMAKRYADPRIKMVMVTTFNEWHDGTSIEPAKEWGTTYLEVIRSVFSMPVTQSPGKTMFKTRPIEEQF